ncbi:shikimate dehydrogenase [Ferruginivarius sediminum]|uniref:Shikimate dehydrogenase (NADP(+)) n=1 Tax=Ferruginivarius sediminum TaxID=2661937 RepID=A0A369TDA7_9PROT|nr:shikimate dehydrogenase [Ferruginivarius sediminum]RDD63270.1 shikimate dehydrogenase [Ferruginivarius sediminum]
MILSGKAALAGVLGWPVAHSRSPRLHGFWLERHGIDGAYVPLPVKPEDFPSAVKALAALGFRGANVTIPHKQAAFQACDEVDDHARRLEAVNTLVFDGGRIRGSNTDGVGFMNHLRQSIPGWNAETGPAVVLGAGGAARAVVVALIDAGVPTLRLVNRTREKAEALAGTFGGPIEVADWGQWDTVLRDASLVVNTTSLGMEGHGPLEVDLDALPASAVVYDIVYQPLKTDLLRVARTRGNATVDGLGMLLHQARPGFEAWFGVRPEVDDELRAFVLRG